MWLVKIATLFIVFSVIALVAVYIIIGIRKTRQMWCGFYDEWEKAGRGKIKISDILIPPDQDEDRYEISKDDKVEIAAYNAVANKVYNTPKEVITDFTRHVWYHYFSERHEAQLAYRVAFELPSYIIFSLYLLKEVLLWPDWYIEEEGQEISQ